MKPKHALFPSLALILPLALAAAAPRTAVAPAPAPVHCQVPCGIYGDQMRIAALLEDASTIEKGMKLLNATGDDALNSNQTVRWVMTKDDHAQSIQDQVAAYWLAQRIKAPKAGASEGDVDRYHGQLELLHRITVAAMKCKQTTDAGHVAELRRLADAFSKTYFSAEELEHLREHTR